MLVAHMSSGLSYETFGATIDVSRAVVYDWEKTHPEFLDAKTVGVEKCQIFWEQKGIDHLINHKDGPALNSTVWVFNMKNRFKWRDQPEQTVKIVQTPGSQAIEIANVKGPWDLKEIE